MSPTQYRLLESQGCIGHFAIQERHRFLVLGKASPQAFFLLAQLSTGVEVALGSLA